MRFTVETSTLKQRQEHALTEMLRSGEQNKKKAAPAEEKNI